MKGPLMKIYIIFHSLYGHIYKLAEAEAEGARKVDGAEVKIFQVPETLTEDIIAKMGATETKKQFAHIPVANPQILAEADGIIFGAPTRFGMICAQMRTFLDGTGGLWGAGKLNGKVAGVFTSSNMQHGGQESTILSLHTTLLHHGMIIAGVPNYEKRLGITSEVSGGSFYGASTIAGNNRMPSENELEIARSQGKYVAEIAKKIFQ